MASTKMAIMFPHALFNGNLIDRYNPKLPRKSRQTSPLSKRSTRLDFRLIQPCYVKHSTNITEAMVMLRMLLGIEPSITSWNWMPRGCWMMR